MEKKITIQELKNIINNIDICKLSDVLKLYDDDQRKGIQSIIKSGEHKIAEYNKELLRMETIQKYEKEAYSLGYEFVGGVDEVGRGPLAGPVVTACVVLPKGLVINGINDSKKLTAKKREELSSIIMEKANSVSIGIITPKEIDLINIYNATIKAMEMAIKKASVKIDFLLIDAMNLKNINIKQNSIIKGDEKSISIGAASIVAKVHRDNLMKLYDEIYPEYNFVQNKGYGTEQHIQAIKTHGICEIHRKSFITNIVKTH